MNKKRKTYSREFKIKLVELSKSRGKVSAVARKYKLPHTLDKKHERNDTGSFPGRGKPKMTEQEAKMTALKKELEDVKEERDILKKAVHFFSKSGGKPTGL